MAKTRQIVAPGQILTVTPTGNVQVYAPGAAAAGGFLAAATSYGPYASAREFIVDGSASISLSTFDPTTFRGTFTANGASAVTVPNTNVIASDAIVISLNTVGGTVGALPAIQTLTPGNGFTVKGTAGDTSVYNYALLRNAS